MKLKKGDLVVVISGSDKGKKGKIKYVDREKNRVIVEGVNFVRKHTRPRRMGEQAGIMEIEAPVDVSNVMLICPRCKEPAKIGRTKLQDGKSARYCKKCKEIID
jgi:large subunit ribosomal protein L24|uniref:Large ribosomal subunit protein uL24 n=1 Tax=candidate division WOR-3 bacterium TaxID=2052148 RepID=A0A7C4U8U9_UNCW3